MYDARKIKVLTDLLLKQETRGREGTRKKIFLLFVSYLLPGVFLSMLLYRQNSDPTGFQFAFLTYLFFSVLLAFTIITEFENLIITRTEIDIFTSLPVDDELIVYAKLRVIMRYVFIISIPVLVPGGIYYYLAVRSIPHAIVYFVSGYLLFYFLVNVMIFIYSVILKKFKAKRLSLYILIFQIFLVFLLVIGYQFVTYSFTGFRRSGIDYYFNILFEGGITQYFPQSWFAFVPARQSSAPNIRVLLKALLPLFICFMSYYNLKYYLLANYGLIRERFLQSRAMYTFRETDKQRYSISGSLLKNFLNIYLRNKEEVSSFGLVRNMFLKDRVVRMNVLPMMAVPVGLTIFALLTNQLPPPISRGLTFSNPSFHYAVFLTVLMAINTAVRGIKLTADAEGSWIYDAFPISNIKHFRNGIRKFFVINVLLPMLVILFILFIPVMPALQAIIHTIFIFASANLFISLCFVLGKELPFTKDNSVMQSLERITTLIYPLSFGAVMLLVQHYVYSETILAAVSALALITLTFWINYFGLVRYNRETVAGPAPVL